VNRYCRTCGGALWNADKLGASLEEAAGEAEKLKAGNDPDILGYACAYGRLLGTVLTVIDELRGECMGCGYAKRHSKEAA
jgi:hypothetical protein